MNEVYKISTSFGPPQAKNTTNGILHVRGLQVLREDRPVVNEHPANRESRLCEAYTFFKRGPEVKITSTVRIAVVRGSDVLREHRRVAYKKYMYNKQ